MKAFPLQDIIMIDIAVHYVEEILGYRLQSTLFLFLFVEKNQTSCTFRRLCATSSRKFIILACFERPASILRIFSRHGPSLHEGLYVKYRAAMRSCTADYSQFLVDQIDVTTLQIDCQC